MKKAAENQHPWDVSIADARTIQVHLAEKVERRDRLGTIRHVAGVDVGFENKTTARAAVAVLSYPQLQLVDYAICRKPVTFPYVPGYLSFRECPAILEALDNLRVEPDLLLCDGQGIAHPRRLGVACHLGVLTGLPSIGVAKSRLLGSYDEVPDIKGAWSPLKDAMLAGGSETIGAVLRSRVGVKPLFISVGHRLCLETAVAYVMSCLTRFRLPETTRWADGLASRRPGRWLQEGIAALDKKDR